MTLNQREFRSPDSRVKQVLMRLQREAESGSRAIPSFAAICDITSIPRDLRAGLLEELVREGYVTRQGDTVCITEAGIALATEPVTSLPVAETRNPSPHDAESRARMRGSRRG